MAARMADLMRMAGPMTDQWVYYLTADWLVGRPLISAPDGSAYG
jgi:hypothetical protein